jgi:competence protein ComEC
MLVDAGGSGGSRFDIGRRVVEPVIWALGVRRVTYLVVTHGDLDHAGGAPSLVRDLAPLEVWEGVPVPPHPLLRTLHELVQQNRGAWRMVQRGDRLQLGGVDVVAWHPPLPDWERQRVRNDDSVVIELRFGQVSIVLPGDVEAGAEALMAPLIPPVPIRVVQVPHHGSGSSSSWPWLRALAPSLAVVSVGRGNRYGHPHAAVLGRYRILGVPLLRTDRDGAISLETDGRSLVATTFSGKRLTIGSKTGPTIPPA